MGGGFYYELCCWFIKIRGFVRFVMSFFCFVLVGYLRFFFAVVVFGFKFFN